MERREEDKRWEEEGIRLLVSEVVVGVSPTCYAWALSTQCRDSSHDDLRQRLRVTTEVAKGWENELRKSRAGGKETRPGYRHSPVRCPAPNPTPRSRSSHAFNNMQQAAAGLPGSAQRAGHGEPMVQAAMVLVAQKSDETGPFCWTELRIVPSCWHRVCWSEMTPAWWLAGGRLIRPNGLGGLKLKIIDPTMVVDGPTSISTSAQAGKARSFNQFDGLRLACSRARG